MTGERREPRTEAAAEVLASQRRVIEQVRVLAFPDQVGQPIIQDAMKELLCLVEDEAQLVALAAERPAPLDDLRAAVVAFYSTPHPSTMDEATHLPVWHVPDHSYGELRRAVDALTDPTQRRLGEYPEAAEPPAPLDGTCSVCGMLAHKWVHVAELSVSLDVERQKALDAAVDHWLARIKREPPALDVDVLAQAMTQAAPKRVGIYAEAEAIVREYRAILAGAT